MLSGKIWRRWEILQSASNLRPFSWSPRSIPQIPQIPQAMPSMAHAQWQVAKVSGDDLRSAGFSREPQIFRTLAMAIWPGWWFGTCVIFSYIGKNHPNWHFSEGLRQRGWDHQLDIYMSSWKWAWNWGKRLIFNRGRFFVSISHDLSGSVSCTLVGYHS